MTERLRGPETRRLLIGVAFVAVLAYAYWFTDRQPFTGGASRALLVPIVVLVVVAEVRRIRGRRARVPDDRSTGERAPRFRSAVAVWSTVVPVLVAWELLALRSSPRSAHPTISSLVESIEQYHVGRIALFFAWLWLGWTLAS